MPRLDRGIQYAAAPVCVHNTRRGVLDRPPSRTMTASVSRDGLGSVTHFKQQASVFILAADLPEFCFSPRPHQDKGAGKAGRRLAPADPCAVETHTGWITGLAGSPGLPCAMVLTVSFVLSSGSDALLPPSRSRMADARARSGRHITARLDASLRASGPHDFSVRARLRWNSEGWRVLAPEAMRRRCQRRVVCA
ncbi:hypothetical protein FHR88_005176 [Bradyrhizobium betae]|nr:hypothetical protein [Bradyrhizobium betae]